MKHPPHFFLFLAVWCGLVSCKPAAETPKNVFAEYRGVPVAATLPVVADLLKQIGGVRVKVDCLIPLDSDPQSFAITPEVQAQLAGDRALFHVGLEPERALIAAARNLPKPLPIFALGGKLPPKSTQPNPAGQPGDNPYFWLDASLWSTCIQEVVDGLASIDPEGREVYEQNAGFYREKLTNLHVWAKRRSQECPPQNRLVVTTRNDLIYFGQAYFIDTVAVLNDTNIQPCVNLILQRGLKTVFTEAGVPRDLIDKVAISSGVDLKGPLYIYGPAQPGSTETSQGEEYDLASYVGMMKHNINTIVEALR